jgi:hypothetical protein
MVDFDRTGNLYRGLREEALQRDWFAGQLGKIDENADVTADFAE